MISIYALINPINNQVFYIGATINPISRLSLHRHSMGLNDTKKDAIFYSLVSSHNIEPELFILDTCSLEDANFWEVFYTDLYISYGFDIKKCTSPYNNFDRKLARKKSENKPWKYANSISRKIDGKDIHYYRKLVLNHFNFYQHT